jgi:GNAT superfamily N-acetyltransferase
LELWAAELGYTAYVLETGRKQPEAIRIYQKAGYTVIPNYGQYKNVENSVCMTKLAP